MDLLIKLLPIFGVAALFIIPSIAYFWWISQSMEKTQHILSDKELIELIAKQPDGFVTVDILVDEFGLTKNQAGARLSYLMRSKIGVLKVLQTSNFSFRYTLVREPTSFFMPHLSNAPFITTEDLLILFKQFDYRLTLQDVCIASGLPIYTIERELNFFKNEKMVESFVDPKTKEIIYLLREPYRSDVDIYLEESIRLNKELEKIVLNK